MSSETENAQNMARGWKEFSKGIQQRQKPTIVVPCSVNGMVFSADPGQSKLRKLIDMKLHPF
ncbi:hypothetical protein HETIRDRAFT_331329 [Heterobasidion irregulare TC 32-1]|uniref:Uncharacterized protein n=1 Tax=Heterobasidion irregulare (strain TC 32-1) TaxID=747525 RepID=W4JPN6_HETIT|nr:uncharacterized protein HETIRDRAFT_331329 [Heterobasidion irregulare TC 32-1]ETW75537.1 hypothetical protein HETIRDRAFT_331329 [Heterobasidion irregulare TC 32-1]